MNGSVTGLTYVAAGDARPGVRDRLRGAADIPPLKACTVRLGEGVPAPL